MTSFLSKNHEINLSLVFNTDNVFNIAQLSLNYITCGATLWSNYIGITPIIIELNYIPKSLDKLLCLVLLSFNLNSNAIKHAQIPQIGIAALSVSK